MKLNDAVTDCLNKGFVMTTCKKFEDLEIWKEARVVVNQVYRSLKECRDYGFKDQMQRAAVSIMNNIAEGFDRASDVDFARFLSYANGSCAEVRSMSYIGLDLGYLTENEMKQIHRLTISVGCKVNSLMVYLKK